MPPPPPPALLLPFIATTLMCYGGRNFNYGGAWLNAPPPKKNGSIDRNPQAKLGTFVVQMAVVLVFKDTWSPVNSGYTCMLGRNTIRHTSKWGMGDNRNCKTNTRTAIHRKWCLLPSLYSALFQHTQVWVWARFPTSIFRRGATLDHLTKKNGHGTTQHNAMFSGVPRKWDKIGIGYAYSGVHHWAELLRNPCVLRGP